MPWQAWRFFALVIFCTLVETTEVPGLWCVWTLHNRWPGAEISPLTRQLQGIFWGESDWTCIKWWEYHFHIHMCWLCWRIFDVMDKIEKGSPRPKDEFPLGEGSRLGFQICLWENFTLSIRSDVSLERHWAVVFLASGLLLAEWYLSGTSRYWNAMNSNRPHMLEVISLRMLGSGLGLRLACPGW